MVDVCKCVQVINHHVNNDLIVSFVAVQNQHQRI
jgi:hypothetical protein